MIEKVLIANRGEIALRILRACKELNIRTVAIHSQVDRDLMHVRLADESVCIGPNSPVDSYLNIPAIISAAEVTDSVAIHPGYGFLAENADFAEQVEKSGFRFIGPNADTIRLMGNKVSAINAMTRAGVPTVPGSDGPITDDDARTLKIAREIGYPVMIKAASGGGGRGMRVAHNDGSLVSGIKAASQEAKAAFGDGTVYIEKFIDHARHVEVQVLGDKHGNVVHLWERDCTMQRRKQKLIEEAPCPVLTQDERKELCTAAARMCKAAGYYTAGTVEFLMDGNKDFYLMEVNTRVQVEHPVTEMITGVDIVKQTIRVAAGEELPFKQKDIKINGHAMECRINAEDPAMNFAPCAGLIEDFNAPGGPGVRMDTHAGAGYRIPPNYDSMIGKLITHAPDREQAITRMLRALAEFEIAPTKTTIPLHTRLLKNGSFLSNDTDINFVERLLGI